MNKYMKSFLHRGLIFGGFGPIITGIIFLILNLSLGGISFSGSDVFIVTISTYLLAFMHAGASVFNQIEHWPIAKSTFFHFSLLFISYSSCYLINSWIKFEPMVLLIFSLVFIIIYFAIWLIVYFTMRHISRRFNEKLDKTDY